MINRENWKLIQEYLAYRKEVDLLAVSSLRLEETWLRHLLEWAQEILFENVSKIRPTLPEYVLDARLDGSGQALSPVYVRKIIRASLNFFQWLKTHHWGYSSITQAWLDTLKPPRMTIVHKEHEAVTIEEIRAIAKAPVETLKEKRIRAAAVLWFLSGIRIGAFVTLPIKGLDFENRSIRQWPKLGVRTKFGKHQTTYFLNIPELIEVVKEWDDFVRSQLSNEYPWFANISPETGELDQDNSFIGKNRHYGARKDLKDWLEKINLPYHSPHKFRHGYAVYTLRNADNIAELKAISQNLMHSSISTTDSIYGILSKNDIKEQIEKISKRINNLEIKKNDDLIEALTEIINQMKK
jgi:site-specific recombinase XerD